jgi:hypothetical protein
MRRGVKTTFNALQVTKFNCESIMKTRSSIITSLALAMLSTFNSQLSTAFAQGSLTPPPGPPGPTMVTLQQIEPRTPISSAPFTISQPGSYYLTTNISVTVGDAIDITTNGVTLDLNGFTISSTAASANGNAIYLTLANGNSDITIVNGHIVSGVTVNNGTFEGPGFNNGIEANQATGYPFNVRVSGVSVSGCLGDGVNVGSFGANTAESCVVNAVGGAGIDASYVSHCTAFYCGRAGINAGNASDCAATSLTGIGFLASTANNCYGSSQDGPGLYAITANNCYGFSGDGTGLDVTDGTAIGCFGSSQDGVGISANIANSCTLGGGTESIANKYNMP